MFLGSLNLCGAYLLERKARREVLFDYASCSCMVLSVSQSVSLPACLPACLSVKSVMMLRVIVRLRIL